MADRKVPTKQGQVVKCITSIPRLSLEEVYLVVESSSVVQTEDIIKIVSLTDLQKNIHTPLNTTPKEIEKSNLMVVGDDLTTYVQSWNDLYEN